MKPFGCLFSNFRLPPSDHTMQTSKNSSRPHADVNLLNSLLSHRIIGGIQVGENKSRKLMLSIRLRTGLQSHFFVCVNRFELVLFVPRERRTSCAGFPVFSCYFIIGCLVFDLLFCLPAIFLFFASAAKVRISLICTKESCVIYSGLRCRQMVSATKRPAPRGRCGIL